jgi:diguanylate cyclase (GGDEF)-like protein
MWRLRPVPRSPFQVKLPAMPKSAAESPTASQMDSDTLRLTQEVDRLRAQVRALAEQLAEAERLADRDVLTPLLNRRAFLREVQRAIAMARRYDAPACVIYMDLNGFKTINDRHGHAVGDTALITVSDRLLGAVREEDIVARIGGDEFAVLLQHADAALAVQKAAVLRDAIARTAIPGPQGQSFHIDASYGVREISRTDSAEQALAEADAAMYLRKTNRSGAD